MWCCGIFVWTSVFITGSLAQSASTSCPSTQPNPYTLMYMDPTTCAQSNYNVSIARDLFNYFTPSTNDPWPAFLGSYTYLGMLGLDSHLIRLKTGGFFVPKQVSVSARRVRNMYIEAFADGLKNATYTTKVDLPASADATVMNRLVTTQWATNVIPIHTLFIHYRVVAGSDNSFTVASLYLNLCTA